MGEGRRSRSYSRAQTGQRDALVIWPQGLPGSPKQGLLTLTADPSRHPPSIPLLSTSSTVTTPWPVGAVVDVVLGQRMASETMSLPSVPSVLAVTTQRVDLRCDSFQVIWIDGTARAVHGTLPPAVTGRPCSGGGKVFIGVYAPYATFSAARCDSLRSR